MRNYTGGELPPRDHHPRGIRSGGLPHQGHPSGDHGNGRRGCGGAGGLSVFGWFEDVIPILLTPLPRACPWLFCKTAENFRNPLVKNLGLCYNSGAKQISYAISGIFSLFYQEGGYAFFGYTNIRKNLTKTQIPASVGTVFPCHCLKFVWRQSEFAFFGA